MNAISIFSLCESRIVAGNCHFAFANQPSRHPNRFQSSLDARHAADQFRPQVLRLGDGVGRLRLSGVSFFASILRVSEEFPSRPQIANEH